MEPYLAALREKSDARIATNQDFIYIRQDIEEFKKLQADKTFALNEREEIKQHEEIAGRNNARDAERAVRPVPDETIYDITVENVEPARICPRRSLSRPLDYFATTNGITFSVGITISPIFSEPMPPQRQI